MKSKRNCKTNQNSALDLFCVTSEHGFMIFRRMGGTGIKCSIIGLGTGRLASAANGISGADAGRLLGVAEDCGINLIDTADSYAQGGSEKIIGAALQGKRSRFIITTKAGYCFSAVGGGLRLLKPLAKRVLKYFKGGKNLANIVRSNVSRQDFTPDAINRSIHGSLQRLRTDYLDFFLLHCPTLQAMSDARLFELLRQLKQAGKIRHFGISSFEPAVVARAFDVAGVSLVQVPLNPADIAIQAILPKFESGKIGVVANQIFLSGKLLGSDPVLNEEERKIHQVKTRLDSLAATKGISLHRLLIEFALGRPGVVSVLTGTNNPAHLKQNVADALAPGVLSPADLAQFANTELLVK
ncbi:MAG: Aldo/keto reductase [Pedosphaera sp.]|nr:Aldo/keto reductase [Pedosphaera sp.]